VLKLEIKRFLLDFFSSKFELERVLLSDKIEGLLNEIYPDERVLINIKRILENDYYLQIYIESIDYLTKYLEIVLKISAFSNYLTDVMVRNPEFLTRFLSSGELNKNFTLKDFSDELEQQVSIYKSFEKKLDSIRRFKRLHLLRIGLRDILSLCDLEQTMLEYSFLTQAILNKIFQLVFDINQAKIKIKKIPDYVLISLGKLGGLELNFSSDVDLICFYDNPDEKISSEVLEFYDKVLKDFIQICIDAKDGSPLYRIDFRLRPDGKYSPLARSISYYQIYYETYGRDWERQMLLKMNFISGNKILFEKFYRMIESFIFPRSFFVSPQTFIQKFRNIYQEKFSADIGNEDLNLKHFKGGIRDVEFSIQALQLLHGGKFKNLRTPNTIDAIINLTRMNLIENETGKRLIDSYKFLRKIENFIQLMDDRQLHSIPQDQDRLQNLIKYLRIKDGKEFQKKLKSVRKIVSDFAEKVFESQSEASPKNLFGKIKVNDQEKFEKRFQQIIQLISDRAGSHLTLSDGFEQKTFQLNLVKLLKKCDSPEKVLNYLYKFISGLHSSFQIFELLRNVNLLKSLIKIFDNSEHLSQLLISDNKIIDLLFSGQLLSKFNYDISLYKRDELQFFIYRMMFSFFSGNLDVEQIGKLISDYIDVLITKLTEENLKKFKMNKNDFALISLGSYGTTEIHFKSDLDFMFCFADNIDKIRAEKFSLQLLSDFREEFKLLDSFQVDSKLRPEGRVSKLSWTISELEKYINSRMRIWEFQAYTKMRLIYGSTDLFDKLIDLIKSRIQTMDKNYIASEIRKNRINIKSGKISELNSSIDLKNSNGGLMDLQFFIQYNILTNNFTQQLTGKTFSQTLTLLSRSIPQLKLYRKTLKSNYIQLLKMILIQQVLTGKRGFLIDRNFESKLVRKIFRIDNRITIFQHFKNILDENFEIVNKLSPEIF